MEDVRIAVYQFKPGTVDEVIRRAKSGMLPTFRSQPGFISHGLAKTGEQEVISISV
jgi:heme-degrading monooxygenase HmoA